jgi:hypothetical protein
MGASNASRNEFVKSVVADVDVQMQSVVYVTYSMSRSGDAYI